MRSNKVNYLVVGGFVLAMLVALVISLALLTGRTGSMDTYYTVLSNVTGIKFGTQVLYEGYVVGQVETVSPVEENGRTRFKIEMSVNEGWQIPDDSLIRPAAAGLLAAKTLAISAGLNSVPLKPGSTIPSAESRDMFSVVSNVATDLSDLTETSIKPLLASMQRAIDNINQVIEGQAGGILADFRKISSQLDTAVPGLVADVRVVAANLKDASGDVRGLVANADAAAVDVRKMASNLASLSADMKSTAGKLDRLLDGANGVVGDNREKLAASVSDLRYIMEATSRRIDSINQNMEGTARNMYEFSRQIRQNPGLLLGGSAPTDEAATAR